MAGGKQTTGTNDEDPVGHRLDPVGKTYAILRRLCLLVSQSFHWVHARRLHRRKKTADETDERQQ